MSGAVRTNRPSTAWVDGWAHGQGVWRVALDLWLIVPSLYAKLALAPIDGKPRKALLVGTPFLLNNAVEDSQRRLYPTLCQQNFQSGFAFPAIRARKRAEARRGDGGLREDRS